jgi:predicted aspartyl protease
MITGTVSSRHEAIVALTVAGPLGERVPIQAVVDTGFNGYLTLSPDLVAALGLPFHSIAVASLV